MAKRLKLLLSLSTISTFVAGPSIVLISGKPKEVDPKFDTYLAIAKTETKKAIEKAIENAIIYLEAKLKEVSEKESEDVSALPKRMYLTQIVDFYKNNKADIIDNPQNYGINTVLPFVLSKDRKLLVVKITYNGRVYDGVKIGQSEIASYEEKIKPDGKIEVIKEINNTLTEVEFKTALKKYTDDLVANFNNMVYQQADTPNFKIVLKFKFEDGQWKPYLTITPPDGFTSWKDAIINSIKPRFNEFDIKHSQGTDFIQEEDEKPEKPEKVPLVPGDKPKPIEKDDIDALPNLEPLIRSENLSTNIDDLINKFISLKSTENIQKANELFLFQNPINTRYLYEVEELKNEAGVLKAKVRLSDSVKTDKNRIYNAVINLNPSLQFKKERMILENQIDEVKINFKRFLESLGLNEKIDYDDLGNDNLQQTLFTMVEIAGKLINTPDFGKGFKELWEKDTKNFANNLSNDKNLDASIIKEARTSIKELFLITLANTIIHLNYKVGDKTIVENYNYWHSITKAYEQVFKQFEESIHKNKTVIENNFKVNSLKPRVLENLYEKIRRDLLKLKAESTQRNPLFVEKWYSDYLKLVKEIKSEFNILRDLATIKVADSSNKEEQKKFTEAYKLAQKKIENQFFAQNKLKVIWGSVLLTIGAINTIISLLSMLLKFKTNKKRKVIIVYLLILIISLAILASGITILALGMKGI
ncbi:hypothetical protein DMC14_002930 [Metamycoplasma phocicerebrale]|uniref:Transmembrane protein n=1 Tax=Metamycoplasma phocicerebrale TaxID=142649 RepID=A0A3T0TUS3_9BACT|nr:hypothetical protein [Metamycoplasma phocicerebrale]AZZ65719.1 hypothetical protein DMC14_002930 [Metamycoplasma phocicerebrale]